MIGLLAAEFRAARGSIMLLLAPALLIAAVAMQPWIAPADLLRDPIAVAETKNGDCCSFYYGAVSNIGVLIWTAAASVSLFSGLVVATRSGWRSPVVVLLLGGGLLTTVLAVDDFFLIHENALAFFGVPQPLVYGVYGVCGLIFLAAAWRQLLQSHPVMFGIGGGFLALSVAVDMWFHSDSVLRIALEDGFKLVGITAWAVFFVAASWDALAGGRADARIAR